MSIEVEIRRFWNYKEWKYQDDPPMDVAVGTRVGYSARVSNNSGRTIIYMWLVQIHNPDGSLAEENTFGPATLDPGRTAQATRHATPYVAGDYTGSTFIIEGGIVKASDTNVFIGRAIGGLGAQIMYPYFWNPNTGEWDSSSPRVPLGSYIGIQPGARNMTDHNLRVWMNVTLTDPDGVKTDHQGGEVVLYPKSHHLSFARWDFLWQGVKPGSYIADMYLHCEGDYDTQSIEGISVALVEETAVEEISDLAIDQYNRV